MQYTSIDQILEHAKEITKPRVVAVPAAEDNHALEAVLRGYREKIVEPILIGNKDKISAILKEIGGSELSDFIVHCNDWDECASLAVDYARDGKAQLLLKGCLQSSQYLKPIMSNSTGLKTSSTLSLVAFSCTPAYPKVFVSTDGGVLMKPNLEQKKAMIQNAVSAMRDVGFDGVIRVAVLCAVETVNPKMPETLDAAALKEMNLRGEISDFIVEGPISFDLATNPSVAKDKHFESPVAGCADLLVYPEIAAANIAGKAMAWSGVRSIAYVAGASVPVALPSRGSNAEAKYRMMVFCASAAK